ncbi:MAG: AraC family ligand binding domain-containing protein, partial [Acetobacteraceae bacterium]|nr:AraC family ligand binding domain-containing protein [Acetobacteraceae bacterium]
MATGGHLVSQDGQALATRAHERARRPVVGYAADYPDGWRTGMHWHPRAQLLTATGGVMRVEAEGNGYVVPPGTGLFVPARLEHRVTMDGMVRMRALFLRPDAARKGPDRAAVIAVSPLLRELILAACAEPLAWDLRGRGRHLAALALDEIARAEALPLALPMPRDARARRVAEAIRAAPGDGRDLAAHGLVAGASARTL